MTRNGERLGNHVLCHNVTIYGIELFPNEGIYFTSTQKCSYSIFFYKKETTIPQLPDDTAFISSLLRSAVDRHRSFFHSRRVYPGFQDCYVDLSQLVFVPYGNNFAIFNRRRNSCIQIERKTIFDLRDECRHFVVQNIQRGRQVKKCLIQL